MSFIKDEMRYDKGIIVAVLLVLCLLFLYTSWHAHDLETTLLELESRIGVLEKLRFEK